MNGLALAPDGKLWGATWPDGGNIVRFNRVGNVDRTLTLPEPARGIAFGQAGTVLENLLFATHSSGNVQMIDVATLDSVTIALGGTRAEFIHAGGDGRLYVTQSTGVTVFATDLAPRVVSTNPSDAGKVAELSSITVRFDTDVEHASASDAASAINPANYEIRSARSNAEIDVGRITYDASWSHRHTLVRRTSAGPV